MWVTPKNLNISPSVQDTGELILDSKDLSDLSEPSLLWRSKPSPSATWSQRWKKGLLRQHLYGRILKPSIGKSSVEEWISSQEASLASPFLPQDEDKQTPTPDTSSHTSSEDSKYANLPLFSLRMSKESSHAKLSSEGWSDPKGTSVLLHVLRELERVGYEATAGIFSAREVGLST